MAFNRVHIKSKPHRFCLVVAKYFNVATFGDKVPTVDMLRHFYKVYDRANNEAELIVVPEMFEECQPRDSDLL
mgnify:CR=1 FL=1